MKNLSFIVTIAFAIATVTFAYLACFDEAMRGNYVAAASVSAVALWAGGMYTSLSS